MRLPGGNSRVWGPSNDPGTAPGDDVSAAHCPRDMSGSYDREKSEHNRTRLWFIIWFPRISTSQLIKGQSSFMKGVREQRGDPKKWQFGSWDHVIPWSMSQFDSTCVRNTRVWVRHIPNWFHTGWSCGLLAKWVYTVNILCWLYGGYIIFTTNKIDKSSPIHLISIFGGVLSCCNL